MQIKINTLTNCAGNKNYTETLLTDDPSTANLSKLHKIYPITQIHGLSSKFISLPIGKI